MRTFYQTLGQTDIALKQTLKTLQQGNKKFDAIMALDDQSAIGALAACDHDEKLGRSDLGID